VTPKDEIASERVTLAYANFHAHDLRRGYARDALIRQSVYA
jgi:hypothetical protein